MELIQYQMIDNAALKTFFFQQNERIRELTHVIFDLKANVNVVLYFSHCQ